MQQGDAEGAERDYLRMFLRKWTLTNFYFRQRRPHDFFHWANAALQVAPYSPDPIFAQMWLVSQDAGRIAAAIPERAACCCSMPGSFRTPGSLRPSRPSCKGR